MTQFAYDIYLAGLGICGCRHITREVDDVLRFCRKVFCFHPDPAVEIYLRTLGVPVTTKMRAQKEGRPRVIFYNALAKEILDAARETAPVALAMYGHPKMFVYPSEIICRRAARLGLRVKMLAGVSSLDSMIIDLDMDPGRGGLLMYETNYALIHRPPLNRYTPCFLWQIGVAETHLHSSRYSIPRRFLRLQKYLLRYYPRNHRMALITSSTNPSSEARIDWFTLSALPEAAASTTGMATLFIPSAEKPRVVDYRAMALMTDRRHLREITSESPVAAATSLLRLLRR
jgi:hypothetical protein